MLICCCSHAIMKYLVNQYAKDDSLCPKDPKKEAIVNQRQYFEAAYFFPRFIDYFVSIYICSKISTSIISITDVRKNIN